MKNAKQQVLRNWGQGGPNQMLVGKEAEPSASKGLELHLTPDLIFRSSYGPEPWLPSLDLQDSRLDLGPAAAE